MRLLNNEWLSWILTWFISSFFSFHFFFSTDWISHLVFGIHNFVVVHFYVDFNKFSNSRQKPECRKGNKNPIYYINHLNQCVRAFKLHKECLCLWLSISFYSLYKCKIAAHLFIVVFLALLRKTTRKSHQQCLFMCVCVCMYLFWSGWVNFKKKKSKICVRTTRKFMALLLKWRSLFMILNVILHLYLSSMNKTEAM